MSEAGRAPGEGASDYSFSALHILEAFQTSVKNSFILDSTSLCGLFIEHDFNKSPVTCAPSFASALQYLELQITEIYSLSNIAQFIFFGSTGFFG